ncbi:MAG: hypothetical protein AAB944_01700 [Patescibacteria group bacterium]
MVPRTNGAVLEPTLSGVQSIKDKEGALAYRHPVLLKRFAKKHGLPVKTAEHQFIELKKFLVVCGMMESSCSPSQGLDEIWHAFILHTRDYQEFCERYIGGFIHHRPTEKPFLGSRKQMIGLAEELFGSIDRELWPKEEVVACDGATCVDYCSDDL